MANVPGTIWQKVVPFFGAPPQWVQVGNFAQGVKGDKGDQGKAGVGTPGPAGQPGPAGTTTSAPRGYIDGFVLSNDSGTPTTLLDIGAGHATDTAGSFYMSRQAIVKDISASWAVGNTFGGMFTGAVANSTWYHVHVIHRDSDGLIDAGFDTSVTAAHAPVGWSNYRRIGSVLTDGSAHIIAFHQYGEEFFWDTSLLDINVTNPGTSAVTRTLTVPTGLKVASILSANCYSTTLNIQSYISSLDSVDQAVSFANAIESGAGDTTIEGLAAALRVWTNTSSQVRSRLSQSDGNTTLKIRTLGWRDQRGRNA